MEDLKQIQEFFGPPADVNTAYRVDFTRIENKEVVKDFELFKDLEKAKFKFEQLKKDPFMGSIKMEKIYGGQSGDGDRYLGGSEEIGSYSNPVNNTKSSELTDEENDIKIYMTTPSFVSAKRGYKEKEDLMAYLSRRKKATSDFVNGALEENISKSAIMRQIKDAEEILDSGEANGMPLDNETEMLVQQELARLKRMLAMSEAMDINDPVLMKARAAKMKANQPKKSTNPNYKAVKNASKIAFLKKERAQLMRDMEQEAEPEGGPIADEYGDKLNRIDAAIAKLSGRKEMTYDQAIAEDETYASSFGGFRKKLDKETIENELQAKGYETPSTGIFNKILVSKNGERVAMIDTDESFYTKDGKSYQWSGTEKFIDHVESVNEGDTYEKMAAKGKKAGNLKQGTVRKRLNIPKGEKVPITKINKELSRLKKMDKDKDKKGVQLGDKNQKYYKALQLAKTLKTTTNVNEMKANEFVKTVNDEFDLETLELMKKVIDSRVELLNKMQDVANPRTVVKGFRRYDEIAETIRFIKENNPSATSEEIIKELREIKELGKTITEELCAAGKAYRKRRMAAGEKSSAYLSGRAVKVCKGQMSGKKKKKK